MKRSCDVIIPVYKGAEEVKNCIDSVVENSGEELSRIIVVNDASPYEDVKQYINRLQSLDREKMTVINNDMNLGYLKSCNKAIHISQNDIVLLNSDTIVTKGWLRKILNCAYSRQEIATVSPFTNNGMLCSLPHIGQENEIPDGFTINTYAQLIEDVSKKQYPVLPSNFGFCLFVKRNVIDEIGILDDNFGPGYYEENDYCCRARLAGYENVLCDDTFIYHIGSVSFQGAKTDISERNRKFIESRYPNIISEIQQFVENEQFLMIHANACMHTTLWNNNKFTTLFILHKSPFETTKHERGGVEYHVLDLIRSLGNQNYFVMYPSEIGSYVDAYVLTGRVGGETMTMEFPLKNPLYQEQFENREVRAIIYQILLGLRVSCVHIHHFLGHTFDIVELCKELRIKCLFTIHDFYIICPRYTCLDKNNKYCGAADDISSCRSELCSDEPSWELYLNKRRKKIEEVILKIDEVFVPSVYVKGVVERWYKDVRCTVVEHWYPYLTNVRVPVTNKVRDTLNIAFLGAVSKLKGSDSLKALIDANIPHVNIHVYGALGDESVLTYQNRINAIFHGRYQREEIVQKLMDNQIDIVCLLTRVPETYGYTLNEAWLSGCPVICYEHGAIAQRILANGAGWIVNSEAGTQGIIDLIKTIQDKPELLQQAKSKINIHKIHQMKERAKIYLNIYNDNNHKPEIANSQYDADILFNAWFNYGVQHMFSRATSNHIHHFFTSTMYLDKGKGFNEMDCLRIKQPIKNHFDVQFDCRNKGILKSIRFDIAENYTCKVKIEEAHVLYVDGDIKSLGACTHNGIISDDWIVFYHTDPSIVWKVQGKQIKYVRIAGEWKVIDEKQCLCNNEQMKPFSISTQMATSNLYFNDGNGYNENDRLETKVEIMNYGMEVLISLDRPVQSIRWDPLEAPGCVLLIKSAELKGREGDWHDSIVINHNGVQKNNWIHFFTADPWVDLMDPQGELVTGARLLVEMRLENDHEKSAPKKAKKLFKN